MTHTVPTGYAVKGVSTLYKPDGTIGAQWVKSTQDAQAREALLAAAGEALNSSIKRAAPVRAPGRSNADLLSLYVVTDYHLGMLSWGEETGDDWDLTIAENLLVDWFAVAIAQAPASKQAVFAQLGDFLHWDGMDAVTPASKHLLDADGRFQKLVRVAIRSLRRVIALLLQKHESVHLIMAEGNHDTASSIWLREWFKVLYENEPRITVDPRPDPYYNFNWGSTSLFFHHGHKKRPAGIADVFAAKFREEFGRSKYAYAHLGHLHHIDQKEGVLMVVEQHRTLAASDAYASRGGWISGRDAQVITYHRDLGEVGRQRVSSAMVEAEQAAKRTQKPINPKSTKKRRNT